MGPNRGPIAVCSPPPGAKDTGARTVVRGENPCRWAKSDPLCPKTAPRYCIALDPSRAEPHQPHRWCLYSRYNLYIHVYRPRLAATNRQSPIAFARLSLPGTRPRPMLMLAAVVGAVPDFSRWARRTDSCNIYRQGRLSVRPGRDKPLKLQGLPFFRSAGPGLPRSGSDPRIFHGDYLCYR